MKKIRKTFSRLKERVVPFVIRRRHRKMTLEGMMFVLLTVIIGLAALNTGANLMYLVLSMMLCLLILSGVISSLTLTGIKVKRIAPQITVAGEAQLARLEIRNSKPIFGSYSLRFMDIDRDTRSYGSGYIFHIPRRKNRSVSYYLLFPRRGLYTLEHIRVGSRFPFGFFERAIDFKLPHQVLVYPRLVDVASMVQGRSIEGGELESTRKGVGTSLYGIREYTPQDSARWIHWKVSARARKIMIREFEKEEKKRVTIILDNSVSQETLADREVVDAFERGVTLAASFAKFFLNQDYNVQILTASGRIPFGTGTSHLHRVLRALALLNLTTEPSRFSGMIGRPEAESAMLYVHYGGKPIPQLGDEQIEIADATKYEIPSLTETERVEEKEKNTSAVK
jgi:uncharacterized protein (DUF58 family)